VATPRSSGQDCTHPTCRGLLFTDAFDRERFVARVAEAGTLYRTRFDPETDRALRALLGEERYAAKMLTAPSDAIVTLAGGEALPVDTAYLAAKWEEDCLPIRLRIR